MTEHPTKKFKKWTPEDDDILRQRYQTDQIRDIASDLHCCKSTVYDRMRRLGLVRAPRPKRNQEARALVQMEFDNLTYKEIGERAHLCEFTISRIANELGLRRSPEAWRANLSRKRLEMIKKERRRVLYGLPQKTRLKVVCNHSKNQLRSNLRRNGYIVGEDGHTFYYTEDFQRHPQREENGRKFGFKFMPLPMECAEETV